MNSCGHKIVKCSSCARVVMQCRCPDPNKRVEYVVACPKCPPSLVNTAELPSELRAHIAQRNAPPDPALTIDGESQQKSRQDGEA